jgi:arylsulfatase A-like enzyme
MEYPAVANYFTAGGACSTADEWQRRFRNSFHAKRSGDVMLSYRPEYVEDFGQGRGVSYGSLYNYDVRVPLFLYGPQFRPGVHEAPVESVDVAPTLARVMGVAMPSSSMGRVLGEAIVE